LLDELAIPRQRLIKAERRNVRLHDLVTRDAGHAPGLVRAPLPEQPRALLVALQARSILLLRGEGRVLAKPYDRAYVASALDMGASGPVTGFAAAGFQWSLGVL
jgi:hypothetical protein